MLPPCMQRQAQGCCATHMITLERQEERSPWAPLLACRDAAGGVEAQADASPAHHTAGALGAAARAGRKAMAPCTCTAASQTALHRLAAPASEPSTHVSNLHW